MGHEHGQGGHQASSRPASPIAQKTCPVSGDPIDPNVFVVYKGKKVYFCCKDCIPQFNKEPAKFMAKVEQQK